MSSTNTNLTPDEVKKIADLARLPISEKEIKTFTPQLSEVLNYFSKLNEVDTDHVDPTVTTAEETNRFQQQKLGSDTLNQEEVSKNAGDVKDGYVRTGQIIDN